MLKIEPYDLSKSFKFIPEKKKYSLLFYTGKSIEFTSKRESFTFISKISNLFVESLALSEMVFNTINSFSFHLKPKSKSNKDYYNKYSENNRYIFDLIKDLKYYQENTTELYKIVHMFKLLFENIISNCKILNSKNNNCVVPYQIIIEKTAKSMFQVIENIEFHYAKNNLSVFTI